MFFTHAFYNDAARASFMWELQIITFLSTGEICYRVLGRGDAERSECPP